MALPAGVAPASVRLEDGCLVWFGHGSGNGQRGPAGAGHLRSLGPKPRMLLLHHALETPGNAHERPGSWGRGSVNLGTLFRGEIRKVADPKGLAPSTLPQTTGRSTLSYGSGQHRPPSLIGASAGQPSPINGEDGLPSRSPSNAMGEGWWRRRVTLPLGPACRAGASLVCHTPNGKPSGCCPQQAEFWRLGCTAGARLARKLKGPGAFAHSRPVPFQQRTNTSW